MKQVTFFRITIAANICFLFLIIYKSSKSIQLSYDSQKILNEKEELLLRQTDLTHKLYAHKNLTSIKKYAHKELGMKTCKMKQIKQLSDNEAESQ